MTPMSILKEVFNLLNLVQRDVLRIYSTLGTMLMILTESGCLVMFEEDQLPRRRVELPNVLSMSVLCQRKTTLVNAYTLKARPIRYSEVPQDEPWIDESTFALEPVIKFARYFRRRSYNFQVVQPAIRPYVRPPQMAIVPACVSSRVLSTRYLAERFPIM